MSDLLTPEAIRRDIERIRAAASDPEVAHTLEDTLRAAVLQAIAEGRCTDPQECARVALLTRQVDFARWCA
jgi:hypothetical protein